MTALQATPGFHGKLPCAGDFVQRRLPVAFIEPWDAAMQQLQWHARDLPALTAVWTFVVAPGVCGTNGWVGALSASHDRVGRRFPLTIAAPLTVQAPLPGWLDAAAELLASAADFADVEAFDAACRALSAMTTASIDVPSMNAAGSAWRRADDVAGSWQAIDGLPEATHAALLLGDAAVAMEPAR